MLSLHGVAIKMITTLVLAAVGVGGAWWLRRRTTLAIRNLYAPAAVSFVIGGGAIAARWWSGAFVLIPLAAPWLAAVTAGRRWQAADLGAGGVSEEPCKRGRKDKPCPREITVGLIKMLLSARSEATPEP